MAFDSVLAADAAGPRRWRRITVAVSLILHVGLLAVGVAYSFWAVDELPLPAVAVTLAGGLPPPPPPPPPARRKSTTGRVRPKTVETPISQPRDQAKPAPREEPEAKEEEKEEKEEEGGQEGGVEGGVKGGVVGGVLGAPLSPATLNANIARAQLLIDPNTEPYKVRLPPALARGADAFSAIVRVCVSDQGAVTDVRVLRGADPAIDPQIPTVLRRWRYRPYQENGRARPFCYLLRYEITAR